MKRYLHILQKEISKISEGDLCVPIKDLDIDSLDLVVLRVALERYLEIEIPDVIWFKCQTLADALEYLHKSKGRVRLSENPENVDIEYSEEIEIRMPQMAKSALSENWLVKYFGDTHWQLITKGFKKKSTEFKDENGSRLYSTFVRINYRVSPLCRFYENEYISFNAGIESFGNNTYLSKIIGRCGENSIAANLMTVFSVRDGVDNNKISRSDPGVGVSRIREISKTPSFLNDYRLVRKGLIDEITTDCGDFQIVDDTVYSCEYIINPYYDINGVGLLYFASYPIIVDKCFDGFYQQVDGLQTVYRDVFYFANCNSTEIIVFKLNSMELIDDGLRTVVSLFRKSDNQMLSRVLTIKKNAY
jgi:acyl carrier protein